MLTEKFTELWESAMGRPVEKNNLCGIYYERPDGRVEIIWRPESPTSDAERTARQIFKAAVREVQDDVDDSTVRQQEFCLIEPTIGHVALRVFWGHDEVIRDMSNVATMRPYISDDLIG